MQSFKKINCFGLWKDNLFWRIIFLMGVSVLLFLVFSKLTGRVVFSVPLDNLNNSENLNNVSLNSSYKGNVIDLGGSQSSGGVQDFFKNNKNIFLVIGTGIFIGFILIILSKKLLTNPVTSHFDSEKAF